MTCFTSKFILFAKGLVSQQGNDIKRWAQDPNPLIAREFQDVLEAAEAGVSEK